MKKFKNRVCGWILKVLLRYCKITVIDGYLEYDIFRESLSIYEDKICFIVYNRRLRGKDKNE